MKTLRVLGICGSLRAQSFNRAALMEAVRLAPPDVALDVCLLGDIPLFNQDNETHPPDAVLEFKQRVREADAILFVTPEYNHSIPGVLKNAIDWGSRPPAENVWSGKPAAIMGASPGMLGTVRAQEHLRQVLWGLNVFVMPQPEVLIANAAVRFDGDGKLTDEKTRGFVGLLVQALVEWARRMQPSVAAQGSVR